MENDRSSFYGRKDPLDAFTTYVLERQEEGMLSIAFQIDHQDLATVIAGQQTR